MPTAHTPGPWMIHRRTQSDGECRPGIWIAGQNMATVVDTGALDVFPLNDANARLIASAPRLLTALRHLMASLIDSETDHNTETGEEYADCVEARAAISEAIGEEWPPVLTEQPA